MKFKHSEALEVPPWKRSRRSGREAKKTGKICGFDAGISPWGTAGWLLPPDSGIRSAFPVFATLPETPVPATGTNGKEEEEPEPRNQRKPGEKGHHLEPEQISPSVSNPNTFRPK